jgi:cytochrome c oxidase subunit 2
MQTKTCTLLIRLTLTCAAASLFLLLRQAPVHAAAQPREITVTAKRFAYEPAEITVRKGEPVVLVLHTEDVAHGLKFADLGLTTEIEKGNAARLAFTPDRVGTFVGHCSHFCGSGHGSMTLTLKVTE